MYIFQLRQPNPIWEGRQKQFSILLQIIDTFFLNKTKNTFQNNNPVSFSLLVLWPLSCPCFKFHTHVSQFFLEQLRFPQIFRNMHPFYGTQISPSRLHNIPPIILILNQINQLHPVPYLTAIYIDLVCSFTYVKFVKLYWWVTMTSLEMYDN